MADPLIDLAAVNGIVHKNAAGVFGLTAAGEPFYSFVKVPASEYALIAVELPQGRPYLQRLSSTAGVGEVLRAPASPLREGREVQRGDPERGERSAPVQYGEPERGERGDAIQRQDAPRAARELFEPQRSGGGRVQPVAVDLWGRAR
jgi:hypothetical protein